MARTTVKTTTPRPQAPANLTLSEMITFAFESLVLFEKKDVSDLAALPNIEALLLLMFRAEAGRNPEKDPVEVALDVVRSAVDQHAAEEAARINEEAAEFEYARLCEL